MLNINKILQNPQDRKVLKLLKVGIEKEGLRVLPDFSISKKPHPKELGSKLTHPYITTDYAESLLEYVTPAFTDSNELFQFLDELHSFTYQKNKDEVIWPSSMPCELPKNDEDIEVADYGKSNIGKLKKLYRIGLGHRYGRKMQSIAGLHYNFSIPYELVRLIAKSRGLQEVTKEVQTEIYFDLIRNYRRYSWLLLYLFGASPLVDKSFIEGRVNDLQKLGKDSFGLPYATALRMGGLGYTSNAQKEISVCYNGLSTYLKNIEKARITNYTPYEKIGVKENGEYKQLNSNLIQIDNEYYSNIRPKAVAKSGMSALQALNEFGIEYVEVRILDLDPFSRVGITKMTDKFLKCFLLFCLFEDSPIVSNAECEKIDKNNISVVRQGRNPKVEVYFEGKKILLSEASTKLLDKISFISDLMDSTFATKEFSKSLNAQYKKVMDPSLTPSAKLIKLVNDSKSYLEVIHEIAEKYKNELEHLSIDKSKLNYLEELSKTSWIQQKRFEEDDDLSFDEFLEEYFLNIKLDKKNA